jgi:hypothetical protein
MAVSDGMCGGFLPFAFLLATAARQSSDFPRPRILRLAV